MTTQSLTTTSGRRRGMQAAALVVLSALVLAACGNGDDGDAAPQPTATTTVTATPTAEPTTEPTDEPTDDLAAGGDGLGVTAADLDLDGSELALDVDLDGDYDADDEALAAAQAEADEASIAARETVFSPLSPWNQMVDEAPIHSSSDALLELASQRLGVDINGEPVREEVDEGAYINTQAWTVPVVAGGQPTILTCRQTQCGDGSDDITLNVPANVDPDPRYDGWYTIFDEDMNIAYDLWRARREDDGTISYQFLREWDLDGPGFNQPYVVSARGSGLPLFGGLIRPGELERCQINHALAISVPGPSAGNYVLPASSTDGNGATNSLPEGARIRLKRNFTWTVPLNETTRKPYNATDDQAKYAQCLVRTLQTYGAIVVDRAAVPTFYFQRLETTRKPLVQGWELGSIHLEDFEVIAFNANDRFPFPSEEEQVGGSGLDDDLDVNILSGEQ